MKHPTTKKQLQDRADYICSLAGIDPIQIYYYPSDEGLGVAAETTTTRAEREDGSMYFTERFITIRLDILSTVPALQDYVLVCGIARVALVENRPDEIHSTKYSAAHRIRETHLLILLGYTVERYGDKPPYEKLVVKIYHNGTLAWAANNSNFKGNGGFYVGPRGGKGERLWPIFGFND